MRLCSLSERFQTYLRLRRASLFAAHVAQLQLKIPIRVLLVPVVAPIRRVVDPSPARASSRPRALAQRLHARQDGHDVPLLAVDGQVGLRERVRDGGARGELRGRERVGEGEGERGGRGGGRGAVGRWCRVRGWWGGRRSRRRGRGEGRGLRGRRKKGQEGLERNAERADAPAHGPPQDPPPPTRRPRARSRPPRPHRRRRAPRRTCPT